MLLCLSEFNCIYQESMVELIKTSYSIFSVFSLQKKFIIKSTLNLWSKLKERILDSYRPTFNF